MDSMVVRELERDAGLRCPLSVRENVTARAARSEWQRPFRCAAFNIRVAKAEFRWSQTRSTARFARDRQWSAGPIRVR